MSFALALVAASLNINLAAAQDYPTRPIRVVIPYSPGGSGDLAIRTVSRSLETRRGWRFVIENKAGASGNIGAADVARAVPDGYTLLLGATNNFVSNQFVYTTMGFDPLQAFAPISLISNSPIVFTTNAFQPFKTFAEFIAYAKANPGRLNYGSPGVATLPHLAGELLSRLAGIRLQHVPFRGGGDVIPSMLGNNVQLFFANLPSVLSQLRSGEFRAMAVGAPVRLEAIPDVPTTVESGFPDAIAGNWWLLAAPRGTETKIVDNLAREIREALADPTIRARFVEYGMLTDPKTPAELQQMLQTEAVRWRQTIEASGIKPN
ncbi:MAG: tripartite tricarboxylate transporter substrate binding protein [Hyphomicrobiales bacterium]|nr:tripartite tricarboxylate transporter substrate binding protein [Hyphomicrobiales bacterium]